MWNWVVVKITVESTSKGETAHPGYLSRRWKVYEKNPADIQLWENILTLRNSKNNPANYITAFAILQQRTGSNK